MPAVINPFVAYLGRYTTASPDHEAAFDEFLAQSPPPTGEPLRLTTRVERFLRERFDQPAPPSVIRTLPSITKYSRRPNWLIRSDCTVSATRGSRRRFLSFRWSSRVPMTISPSSRPTHAELRCGDPSALTVATMATAEDSRSSSAAADS